MATRIFSIALILCVMVSGYHAQKRSNQTDVCLRKNQPSVYLTFERAGKTKLLEVGEGYERVWLRLHNNTRWPIILNMSAAPSKEYGDAKLYHDVMAGLDLVFHGECHVCSFNGLGPGKSLVFSVPSGDLAEGRSIRVAFSYGWEDQNDSNAGREAMHYVLFDSSSLPKNSEQRNK